MAGGGVVVTVVLGLFRGPSTQLTELGAGGWVMISSSLQQVHGGAQSLTDRPEAPLNHLCWTGRCFTRLIKECVAD